MKDNGVIEEMYNIDSNAFLLAVRPVIGIKGNSAYKSGNGSASNPYEIKMN